MSPQPNSRDELFLNELLKRAPKIEAYESTANLLEQIIDNILSEKEEDFSKIQPVKDSLLTEFVDWNEVRIVSADRLESFFSDFEDGEYKLKVFQAFLNKIFSRSGSLDYSFLNDFEENDLDDYLAGIMEMREDTRKRLLLRVFKHHVLPISVEHEIIFEQAQTSYYPGDEDFNNAFSNLSLEELEGVKLVMDKMMAENDNQDDGFGDDEDDMIMTSFSSKTLDEIVQALDAA